MIDLLSWNIRQGGGSRTSAILSAIIDANPGVIVLSEFRNNVNGTTLRTGLLRKGYQFQVVSAAESNTNSVLIASKFPCDSKLFPDSDKNYPHAVIRADFSAFRLYGVYLPHKKKHQLFKYLLEDELDDEYPSIITGDWNTGKNGIDQAGNSFWYSENLTKLEQRGYFDMFRAVHGSVKEYSWFSHQGNGYRYDHAYATDCLKSLLRDCHFKHAWRTEGLSDHSPMWITLGANQ